MHTFRVHVLKVILGMVWMVSSWGCDSTLFDNPLPYSPSQAIDSRLLGYWQDSNTPGPPVSIFQREGHIVIQGPLVEYQAYTFSLGKRKFLNVELHNLWQGEQNTIHKYFIVEYEVIGDTIRALVLSKNDLPCSSTPHDCVIYNRTVYNSTDSLVRLLKALPPLHKRLKEHANNRGEFSSEDFISLKRITAKEYDLKIKAYLMIDERNRIEDLWGMRFKNPMETFDISTIDSPPDSDSLAERAGLHVGDELMKIDDQTFPSKRDIIIALAAKGPKSRFSLTVSREGNEKTIELELPEDPKRLKEDLKQIEDFLGLDIGFPSLTCGYRWNSLADQAGIEPGSWA